MNKQKKEHKTKKKHISKTRFNTIASLIDSETNDNVKLSKLEN